MLKLTLVFLHILSLCFLLLNVVLLVLLQVLARSSPTDKFNLVKLLKKQGDIVAVTGDLASPSLYVQALHLKAPRFHKRNWLAQTCNSELASTSVCVRACAFKTAPISSASSSFSLLGLPPQIASLSTAPSA